MKSNTVKVSANVDNNVYRLGNKIIKELGQTPTSAINSLYAYIIHTGTIPTTKLDKNEIENLEFNDAFDQAPKIKIDTPEKMKEFIKGEI